MILVDVVTERGGDLYRELVREVSPGEHGDDDSAALFAAAFRSVQRDAAQVELWHAPLAIGEPLPTLPLWLRGELCVRVDLDGAYERTCREQRLQ